MTLEEKVAQLYGIMPMAFFGPGGLGEAKMQSLMPHGVGQISGLAMLGDTQIKRAAENANQIQRYLVEKTRLGIPAILDAWYPGQEGGAAIAGALLGEVNPGGRLPVTIPRSEGQIPIYHYHKMGSGYQRPQENTLTQYTDMPLTPLYAFGHGLSYTRFEYGNPRLDADRVDSRGQVQISCDVANVGSAAGDEVVPLYLRDRHARVTRLVQELAGFKRVELAPGAACTVTFTVEMRQLGFYDRDMRFVVEPGHVDVMIGGSSDDIRLRGAFEITGQVVEVMGNRAFTSQASVESRTAFTPSVRP